MSQREFERQIAILKSRLTTLMMARRGVLSIKRVEVRAHDVPAYHINRHTRLVYSRKERKAA